jgi:hypothetical protein
LKGSSRPLFTPGQLDGERPIFDLAIGATLHMFDDTPIDQTSQGMRVVGDNDTNSTAEKGIIVGNRHRRQRARLAR